ncbi:MAG: CooT family nickel-binding protein [Proteobacteria bacterium]|nr:CooT family nickel-binding protein [Desulfobulbaceae bacterium]MBU4153095.1 CooT family nickel-binding protein [Pseudomonadota bacterium]MDP2106586.1 CooT family nickel-binding protein [Desulfobulbaceae bacterium]
MCQMSVILKTNGTQEKIMDAVARLEVSAEGVSINALFDAPRLVPGVMVKEIDFLEGVVVLTSC